MKSALWASMAASITRGISTNCGQESHRTPRANPSTEILPAGMGCARCVSHLVRKTHATTAMSFEVRTCASIIVSVAGQLIQTTKPCYSDTQLGRRSQRVSYKHTNMGRYAKRSCGTMTSVTTTTAPHTYHQDGGTLVEQHSNGRKPHRYSLLTENLVCPLVGGIHSSSHASTRSPSSIRKIDARILYPIWLLERKLSCKWWRSCTGRQYCLLREPHNILEQ